MNAIETARQLLAKESLELKICANCKGWIKGKHDWANDGECKDLTDGDAVEIELKTGWDGGYVSRIITLSNFGCKNFTARELIEDKGESKQ